MESMLQKSLLMPWRLQRVQLRTRLKQHWQAHLCRDSACCWSWKAVRSRLSARAARLWSLHLQCSSHDTLVQVRALEAIKLKFEYLDVASDST